MITKMCTVILISTVLNEIFLDYLATKKEVS
jgi:hypothetical protein